VVNADFVVPVEIDNVIHQVYVLKRPYCDEFLKRMGEMFECILFTASLSKVGVVWWWAWWLWVLPKGVGLSCCGCGLAVGVV